MSSAESEARSVYASNPTTAGYMGGSYSSQRYYDQQRERDSQQQYQDNRPRNYVGGSFNPATGETTGGHPAEPQMAADRARSGVTNQQYRDMNQGYDSYRRSRAVEEAQGRFSSAPKDYYDRPDIIAPTDKAQLNLMQQGYTPEQAAEALRVDAYKRQDYASERKYETLRQQADAATVSTASGYHHWAIDTGLPQAPNPFEYAGDLALYAEKGYPRKPSEAFSPVDPTVLNLPDGKGGQDYAWLPDNSRNYDLRGAMDTIAQAKRSGTMGAYGQLGSPSSSKYGTLSLADQQDIARYVNENPVHQANGFRTDDSIANQRTDEIVNSWRGAYVSSVSPTVATASRNGTLSEEELFKNATVQTTYRPSDVTLAYQNAYGGEKDRNPVGDFLIGASTFIFPGNFEKKTTGKTQETPSSLSVMAGGKEDFGIKAATSMAGYEAAPYVASKMKYSVGSPYLGADGKMYQDYRTEDLSKVTITPTKTEITQGKSGFEIGEQETAKRTTYWIPDYGQVNTGSPLDYPENYLREAVRGFKEKPNTAAINFGVGLGLTALTLGVVNPAAEGVAVTTIASGSKWAIPAAAANVGVKFGIPVALGTMYSYDVYQQATKGGTDFSSAAAGRAGYRGGYETIPMIAGAGAYGVLNAKLTPIETGFQTKLAAGETTGRVNYFLEKPVSRVTSRITADYYQTKELMTTGTTAELGFRTNTMKMGVEGKAVPNPTRTQILSDRIDMVNAGRASKEPIAAQFAREIPGYKTTQPKITGGKVGADDFGVRDYVGYKAGKFVAETKARFTLEGMRQVPAETSSVKAPKLTTEPGIYAKDNAGRLLLNRKGEPIIRAGSGGQEITNEPFFNKLGETAYPKAPKAKGTSVKLEQFRSYAPEEAGRGIPSNAETGVGRTTNENYFNQLVEKAYPAAKERPAVLEPQKSYVSKSMQVGVEQYGTPESYFQSLGEAAYGKPRPVKEQALGALIKIGGLQDQLAAKGWKGFGGAGEPAAPKITTGKPPGAPGAGKEYARMTGTKVVGGKTFTSTLASEPSLKSQGITEKAGLSNYRSGTQGDISFAKGKGTDFRGQQTSVMKPMKPSSYGYQGKQAAGQSLVMSEPLPIVEGMPTSRMSQNVRRGSSGMVSVLQPETVFMQKQSVRQGSQLESANLLGLRFGQDSTTRQALRSQSGQETQQRIRETGMGRAAIPMRGVFPVSGIVSGQKTRQDTKTDLTSITRQGQSSLTRQRTDQSSLRRTITDQSQLYRQWQEMITEKPPTRMPGVVPFALPSFGGGSGAGSQRVGRGRKHTELFRMQIGNLNNLFGGGGGGSGGSPAGGKKIYGSFRGTITTGKGKVVKVRPLPKRYRE